MRKWKTANGLKEHAHSLYDSRWRLWPQFSVPLEAALRCAYELRGKRKRKCHLKFSEESSLQVLIHMNPPPVGTGHQFNIDIRHWIYIEVWSPDIATEI